MDKDARIKELEAALDRVTEERDDLQRENRSLEGSIEDLQEQIDDRAFTKLGIWREGDDVYFKGRWLCDLRPHGPAGDELGTALTEVFPADGFIDRSTKPRMVA
jgi:hypothetical protein